MVITIRRLELVVFTIFTSSNLNPSHSFLDKEPLNRIASENRRSILVQIVGPMNAGNIWLSCRTRLKKYWPAQSQDVYEDCSYFFVKTFKLSNQGCDRYLRISQPMLDFL